MNTNPYSSDATTALCWKCKGSGVKLKRTEKTLHAIPCGVCIAASGSKAAAPLNDTTKPLPSRVLRRGFVRPFNPSQTWTPPGPAAAISIEQAGALLADGEMVTALCGSWVIFQLVQGHRYTTDDLSTAAIAIQLYTTRGNLPRPQSHIDIGCGLGSVLSFVRWYFDDSLLKSVGIEAQLKHVELARKTISINMKAPSLVSDVRHGDLRELASNESGLLNAETEFQSFDLVTGTPPYFPVPNGVVPTVQGRGYCSFEMRGGVETYCLAARQCLRRTSDARFVFVQTAIEVKRSEEAIWSLAQMRILERVDFYGVDGKKDPLFVIFVCGWEPVSKGQQESDGETVPHDGSGKQVKDFTWDGISREECSVRRITVRDKDGRYTPEYHDLLVLVGKPPVLVA
ncbi:hypothetical protein BJ741DRAFT_625772 [Chytriomyces cf. hyalinus JEL632]|nr:hypothetical protein BJ741DRAFT_625772 [Chytriomyces cf. hyalinus JEL632]